MPVESCRRRFEYADANSKKFWELTLRGAEVTVHFGRIGTSGQGETKTFPNAEAATKHADSKIREKLNKGYLEVR